MYVCLYEYLPCVGTHRGQTKSIRSPKEGTTRNYELRCKYSDTDLYPIKEFKNSTDEVSPNPK